LSPDTIRSPIPTRAAAPTIAAALTRAGWRGPAPLRRRIIADLISFAALARESTWSTRSPWRLDRARAASSPSRIWVSRGKVASTIASPKRCPRTQAHRSATTDSMIAASATKTSQIAQAGVGGARARTQSPTA
jgi:hypothetical protein